MTNMSAVRVMWLVATLVAGGNLTARAASPEANAEHSADRGFDVASAFTLRLQLPFTQRVLWQRSVNSGYNLNHDGAITLLGGSLSRRFHDLVEAEAGAALVIDGCGLGSRQRCGWAYRPACRPPAWGAATGMCEYLYWRAPTSCPCRATGCDDRRLSGRVFDMASGIDATRWSPAGRGFNLRLLAGYGFDGLVEATLAMGMAFRLSGPELRRHMVRTMIEHGDGASWPTEEAGTRADR